MKQRLAGLLLLLMLPSAAFAGSLWGPFSAGMTTEEVTKVLDDAYPIEEGDRLATNAVEALRRDGVELAGESFTQRFFFLNDQLSQVTLRLDDTRDFDAMLTTLEALTEKMRDQYGEEADSELRDSGPIRQATASWIDGNQRVSILLMSMGEDDSLLNVNYQPYTGD
ncbi:hypothetical protein SAMN05192555_1077 [Franzmannia pantelleriensis]|uniref:Uncharacterized protein n=1 Tax=Franzmannia pantelleriensis TaxID=48727 RepID=A0A1G9N0H5_9GAMM|nr:hypothetical protein [Halomonas pantelleriensis]SDL80066.1 hypothetical protein SAMN05192555_1077 [Halomonas pantelleriensis]